MSKNRILFFTGFIGNMLEWYDFVIYGYFASIFAELFFPKSDFTIALILSFSAFAVGFFARPLGSLILGYIGDKKGRKPALLFSIILMAVPSFLIMFLPTYTTLGILAPLFLSIFRIFQGISAGGEYTTSITFLLEHSPPEKRAFWTSINLFGAIFGIMLGSFSATLLYYTLEPLSLKEYGWRIAYLPTIFLAVVGYYIRKHTYETPAFIKETLSSKKGFPLIIALKEYPSRVIIALTLSMMQGIAFFILFVYFPTYFSRYLNIPSSLALFSNTVAMLLLDIAILIVALLSDKYGRKPFLKLSLLMYVLFSIPLNYLIINSSYLGKLCSHLFFSIISAFFMSILPVTLAELFPVKIRTTSLSVFYNFSLALFGGTAPMVATYFVEKKNILFFPGIYLSLASALALLIVLIFLPETHPLKTKEVKIL